MSAAADYQNSLHRPDSGHTSLSQYHKTYANLSSSPYHARHRIDGVFNEAANVNITGNLQANIVMQSSGVAGGETVVEREER